MTDLLTRLLVLVAIASATPASAATQLGPLPPGEIARSYAGPSDELIGLLMFDPSLIALSIPPGVRLQTLEEKAREWPRLASYLQAHPERSGWAWSFYEIIGIHAAKYDTLAGRFDQGRGGMAVWYPELVRTDATDPRPMGEQKLATGSWLSDPRLVNYMRSRGFPAQHARVRFNWDSDRAQGDLEAADLTIHGECRLAGPPFIPKWATSRYSYETMWTPAGEGETFEIVTWSGHRSRACLDAVWRVSGTHPFAKAFNDPTLGDPNFIRTEFAYGYMLKSALYRRREQGLPRAEPSQETAVLPTSPE